MRRHLELEVAFERFLRALADEELVQVLQVGQALEEEDALDELVGMLHLVDRLVMLVVGEARQSPMTEHARVEEVLVDRGELVGEHRVQVTQDVRITAHAKSPPEGGR